MVTAAPAAASHQRSPICSTANNDAATKPTISVMPRKSMTIRCGLSRVLGNVRHPAARARAVIGSCTTKIIRQPATASRPAVITGPPKPSVPHTMEFAANARARNRCG